MHAALVFMILHRGPSNQRRRPAPTARGARRHGQPRPDPIHTKGRILFVRFGPFCEALTRAPSLPCSQNVLAPFVHSANHTLQLRPGRRRIYRGRRFPTRVADVFLPEPAAHPLGPKVNHPAPTAPARVERRHRLCELVSLRTQSIIFQ